MNRTHIAAMAFCALSLAPHAASACGGFFCSTTPIEQAGETIVYGLEDDGTLTMSVRINYTGDDDDFAWILPVVAPPELSIGTDALFDQLRRVTEPSFLTTYETAGTCREHPRCVYEGSCGTAYDGSGCGYDASGSAPWTGDYVDAAAGASDASAPVADASAPPDPGVMVFSQGPIGPYESVVLGAATAAEVVAWLQEKGYQVPDASIPLLETYAAAGQVFVALRLRSNVDTRAIRPITLRMPTTEACLPIRLTAIATVPELPITTFFLGRLPVTPANYSTVELQPDQIGYWTGARSWRRDLTTEIQRMGGQAFATDYSGPTPALTLETQTVDDLATEVDAAVYIQQLAARGHQGDPLLLELFETYIQPPADWGGASRDYYNCLFVSGVVSCGEPLAFDPAGLTEQITAQIVEPRAEAHALVHRHNHLTRLYTAMRPQDMTLDAVFVQDEGIEDRSNVYFARRVTACSAEYFSEDAPEHWDLDGVVVPISSGRVVSDHSYCAGLGAIPASEATECPEMSSSSGGCLCMVGGTAPIQGGVLFSIALLLGARRLRRRR
ncbi:MAG: DUF2330 domain-containing protein [Sandaracinaceae bacterium]|nr:DUF2330 domain-containing protein [Sandaracinaceae bacterium]